MKKIILKSFIGALVFFGTGFLLLYLVNARSGLTASSGDKLTTTQWNNIVNQINTLSGQINNANLNCVAVGGTAIYQGNVYGRGSYTVIKRATCSDGYKVTGCSSMDAPAGNFPGEVYSYYMPRFSDTNGGFVTGQGCQWNSEFTNTSSMNTMYSNVNRNVNAICCKIN